MKKSLPLWLALTAPLVCGCSQSPPPAGTDAKPTHVWSTQVQGLQQAKQVAKDATQRQQTNQRRLKELGSPPSQ